MPPDHGELDATQVMNGEFFKAGGYCACLLEPANTALNDVSAAVLRSIE
jgi:hypothetical protein